MEYNLPRWLKKDLGLINITESDLNGLMFHPRHGGLCRKFVKFLAESTLCRKKYPAVFAKENFDEATTELETKTKLLRSTILELNKHVKDSENKQRHVDFLRDKLAYISEVEKIYNKTIEKLDKINSRPNQRIEQIRDIIRANSSKYLENDDLKELYVNDLKSLIISQRNLVQTTNRCDESTINCSANQSMSMNTFQLPVLKRQQSQYQIESEYDDLVRKIEAMHQVIPRVLGDLLKKINELDYDNMEFQQKPQMDEFLALKMPECVEIVVEADKEEKEIRAKNEQLSKRVNELESQVLNLAQQHKFKRGEIKRKSDERLERIDAIKSALAKLNVITN